MATIAEVFSLAWQHHQAGGFTQAEQLYRQILQVNPSHVDAACFLGAVCQAQGKLAEAEMSYRRAVQLAPGYADAHNCLGALLAQEDRLAEAVASFQQALKADPDNAQTHYNLGLALNAQGECEAAIAQFREALRFKPDYPEAMNDLGNALAKQDNLNEAVRCYQQALGLRPNYPEAHSNLAKALLNQGQPDDAVQHCHKALRLNPDFFAAHYILALALHDKGQLEDAEVHYRQALRIRPNDAEAHHSLGIILREQGRLEEAIACCHQASRLKPGFAEVYNNLGNALMDQEKLAEAESSYRQALELRPDYAVAHYNLGILCGKLGRAEEAIAHYRHELCLQPDDAEAHTNLGGLLLSQGQLEQATASFQQALRLKPENPVFRSNVLFCLNYDPQADPDAVFAEHCRYGQMHEPGRKGAMCDVRSAMLNAALPTSHIAHRTSHLPERRLRIGYVSGDLRAHALARYIEPVLAHHDPRRVEVFCYAQVGIPDAVTTRLQSLVQNWRWTCALTDAQLAQQIRDDRIDILVDLAGHTADNRLCVFARKPAPIQVTWLGYMNTTGLTTIDYRLTDDVLDPPGAPVRDTEELMRLPGGACCFAAPLDAPAVTLLPALARKYLTFGSLLSLFKVNVGVFDLWSQLLKAVPRARLLMFHHTLTDTAQAHIRRQFTDRGISSERLDLRQGSSGPGYLGIFEEIDVSLDSFPYTGGVTTCESLWMGVPVLSLRGVRPAGRNSAALLARVGLADWAVETPEQYLALGVRVANDLDRLAQLRSELRDRMAATLCDARRFTRELEDAYRTMWRRWCALSASNHTP